MLEYSLLSPAYRILKDIFSGIRSSKRHLSSSEKIQLRQKWKKEFESELLRRKKEGLRCDVILRDMNRVDNYPETDEKEKGISSWFKVGLMGTYHKGILAGLQWGGLTLDKNANKYRFRNLKENEKGDIKVILIGYIPYENIEAVDWEGDEYGGHPHIYCYFDARKKEPYESLAFCEQKHLNDFPFYTEVADYNSVYKYSKKFKIEYFA